MPQKCQFLFRGEVLQMLSPQIVSEYSPRIVYEIACGALCLFWSVASKTIRIIPGQSVQIFGWMAQPRIPRAWEDIKLRSWTWRNLHDFGVFGDEGVGRIYESVVDLKESTDDHVSTKKASLNELRKAHC